VIDSSWYVRPDGVPDRTAAGGIVARLENDTVMIALGQQDGYTDFVLPKGGVDPGESIREAAEREIHEEAGFDQLTWLADLGIKARLNGAKTKWVTQHYFLFITDQIKSKPTDPRHAPSKWFAIDSLPDLCWPEQLELIVSNKQLVEKLVREHAQSH
tara:strand:- start:1082 stop:1552 length:471 start_codon:yes stop_codon:yes gene_type:complete